MPRKINHKGKKEVPRQRAGRQKSQRYSFYYLKNDHSEICHLRAVEEISAVIPACPPVEGAGSNQWIPDGVYPALDTGLG